MSKYTTELRYICETLAGQTESVGNNDVDNIISIARPLLFNFSYPIFDENYKETLESKIINHFYTREIGFETVGLWKRKLQVKMNEIMPYYNKLYASELLEWEWNKDTDYTITHDDATTKTGNTSNTNSETIDIENTRNINEDNTTTRSGENQNIDKYSDTPMNALSGVESGEYLTNARIVNGTDSSTVDNNGDSTITDDGKTTRNASGSGSTIESGTDKGTTNVTGKQSNIPLSEYLKKYRETFLNIDMMVIEELNELFMLLW